MAEKREYENLLVPVRHPNDVNRVTELASLLVDRGRIVYLTVIKERNFTQMQKDWRKSSTILEKHKEKTFKRKARVIPKIRYSDSISDGILDQADDEDSELIILGWGGKISPQSMVRTIIGKTFNNSDRDILVYKNKTENPQDMEKILFPVGYKEYDYEKRLSIFVQLAEKTGAECVLAHVNADNKSEEEIEEIFKSPKDFLDSLGVEYRTKVIEHENVPDALIEESKNHDLMIIGPSREYAISQFLFGYSTDKIANKSESSIIIFKEGEQKWKAWTRGVLENIKSRIKGLFE